MIRWLDALLGRIFSHGTELELSGGIDFVGNTYAVRNATTGIIEVHTDTVPGAAAGDIAVVGADGVTWEAAEASDLLRTAYDGAVAPVVVAHDAGETWQELTRWARTTLCPTSLQIVAITVEFVLRHDYTAAAPSVDMATMAATYTRRDAADDSITNRDEEESDTGATAVVAWSIVLSAAAYGDVANGLLETRLRRGAGGDAAYIILEARKHATGDREVSARVQFGDPA